MAQPPSLWTCCGPTASASGLAAAQPPIVPVCGTTALQEDIFLHSMHCHGLTSQSLRNSFASKLPGPGREPSVRESPASSSACCAKSSCRVKVEQSDPLRALPESPSKFSAARSGARRYRLLWLLRHLPWPACKACAKCLKPSVRRTSSMHALYI